MAYNNRAVAREALHQENEALSDYNSAIGINSKDSSFYNNRGLIQRKLNNYRAADSDFNSALNLLPNHPVYYFNRAHCCLETNHKEKSKEYLEKGIRFL